MESRRGSSKAKLNSQKFRQEGTGVRAEPPPASLSSGKQRQFVTCHDPKTKTGPVPPVFAQEEPQDRQTAEPGHVQEPAGRGEARACRAILQTQRLRKVVSVSVWATEAPARCSNRRLL